MTPSIFSGIGDLHIFFGEMSTCILWPFLNWVICLYYRVIMEKAMAPYSSTLAWKIPWTEEPGRLQSMGSLLVRHDWATSLSLFTFTQWRRKWQPTPASVLAWRIPGTAEPGGLPSMGTHRVGHDWSYLAAAAAESSLDTEENRLTGCVLNWILRLKGISWEGPKEDSTQT